MGLILNKEKFDLLTFLKKVNSKTIIYYDDVLDINFSDCEKNNTIIILNVKKEMDLHYLYYHIDFYSNERFFYIIVSNKLHDELRKRKEETFIRRFFLE